jgi:hypothetical protein
MRGIRDTVANKLKADVQQEMARKLADQVNPNYLDKKPLQHKEAPSEASLPPLTNTSQRTKSTNKLTRSVKHVSDIAPTVPRQSLIESFVKTELPRPVFVPSVVNKVTVQPKGTDSAARAMRNGMVREYLNAKQQLDKAR